MTPDESNSAIAIDDAILGLRRGDFSRLAPLFEGGAGEGAACCRIVDWYRKGHFEGAADVLAEALTCACFLGRTEVAAFLLDRNVDPATGTATGLNAFHWAANRGNLDTVQLLIERGAPLEIPNAYGGTVLGGTVWAAVHEPKPDHRGIIEALVRAGARLDAAEYPSGDTNVDQWLRELGAGGAPLS